MEVKSGVPQCSILGPLLFGISINDLATVSKKFKFLRYADDTTIYFSLEDLYGINVEGNVSNELNKFTRWLSLNKLSLNIDKTKCMTFHTRQKNIDPLIFSINGKQIENVKFFKFLGIMFDEHLTWINLNTMITNKLSKVIGILTQLKNINPQQALLSIYNALFLIPYDIWFTTMGKSVELVSKLQKKSIRLIIGSEYLAHSERLFKEFELLNIEDFTIIYHMVCYHHILIVILI